MPALCRLLLASGRQQAFPPAAVVATVLALGLALASPTFGQVRPSDDDQPPTPAQLKYDAIRALRDGRYADALTLCTQSPA